MFTCYTPNLVNVSWTNFPTLWWSGSLLMWCWYSVHVLWYTVPLSYQYSLKEDVTWLHPKIDHSPGREKCRSLPSCAHDKVHSPFLSSHLCVCVSLGWSLFVMFTSYDNAIVLMLYRVEVGGRRSTVSSSVANQAELCPAQMTLTTPVSNRFARVCT